MTEAKYDVVGLGNAIVDVISQADDDFLIRESIAKGGMTLIDEERAEALYQTMPSAIESSGGSAANTIAGIGNLGGRGAFVGKVADDLLGKVFEHDIKAQGIAYATPKLAEGSTARCLILVTPDAERSMNTYLGACQELSPADVDEQLIGAAKVTYLEGYLWDPVHAKDAFRKAIKAAKAADRQVALSLSDAFCVERYRDEFLDLIKRGDVDILFANEAEVLALTQKDDFDEAMQSFRHLDMIAALTRGARGSVILRGDEVHLVDAEPVDQVLDTTGAGDLFAAGFLYGLTHERDLYACGKIGGLAAAEIISHYGARPEQKLSELLKSKDY